MQEHITKLARMTVSIVLLDSIARQTARQFSHALRASIALIQEPQIPMIALHVRLGPILAKDHRSATCVHWDTNAIRRACLHNHAHLAHTHHKLVPPHAIIVQRAIFALHLETKPFHVQRECLQMQHLKKQSALPANWATMQSTREALHALSAPQAPNAHQQATIQFLVLSAPIQWRDRIPAYCVHPERCVFDHQHLKIVHKEHLQVEDLSQNAQNVQQEHTLLQVPHSAPDVRQGISAPTRRHPQRQPAQVEVILHLPMEHARSAHLER
mmetsp:Transcript_5857/g.22195  ORF Transcript_5857/g.22195 Transcript_5857/m.22195 type:complete len:270 (-) Transcript_5857:13583-14392(-)